MPDKPRGVCGVCGRPYLLTRDDRVRRHWARNPDGTAASGLNDCGGSGKPPTRPNQEQPHA